MSEHQTVIPAECFTGRIRRISGGARRKQVKQMRRAVALSSSSGSGGMPGVKISPTIMGDYLEQWRHEQALDRYNRLFKKSVKPEYE